MHISRREAPGKDDRLPRDPYHEAQMTPLLRVFLLLVLAAAPLAAQERTLHLPIGDPARRERETPLVLDGVTDTRTGETVTPERDSPTEL